MSQTKEIINEVFIKIFNDILFSEETYLKNKVGNSITLRGMHILEAIADSEKTHANNMKNIANKLNITAGTLTTCLKKLEHNGYVKKLQSSDDKRVQYLVVTDPAKEILKIHDEYHKNMIELITRNLSEREQNDLIDLLSKVKYFFKN